METQELIKQSFLLLDINGLNPTKRNFITKLNIYSSILLTSGFGIECILEVLLKWNGLVSLDTIVAIVVCYQLLTKYAILVLYRDKINQVIDCIHKHYWPLNKCGNGLELKIKYITKIIKKIMFVMTSATVITIVTYAFGPLLSSSERKLPIATFHPRDLTKSPYFEMAYVAQGIILLKVVPPSVLAFDFLFVSLTAHIVFQFRMINMEITTISSNYNTNKEDLDTLQQLTVIGKHHSMVLRCVQYMKEIYSIVLLSQFSSVMFLICLGLLFIIVSGFPLPVSDLIRVVGYVGVFSSLLFLYCFAGTYLTFESEDIANGAFKSNWWIKTQPKLRKSIALIIQRAQKHEALSAGGMITLNLETFSSVIRNSLSFFMVVQTLFIKKQVNF